MGSGGAAGAEALYQEAGWQPVGSRAPLAPGFEIGLYGAGCRLLVLGDGDFGFSAHLVRSTPAEVVATCLEPHDVMTAR